jgi:3',5'-cyclic-AMP phosphodiesterase
MSDLHVGQGLFRGELLSSAVREANQLAPDLVVVAGDLTMEGYRGEFEECKRFLDELACRHVVLTMGNHDARNVGYRHFEDFFGARDSVTTVEVPEGRAKVVAIDSTKPDLDEGEVGREHYGWLDAALRGWTEGPRIVVIHHHILAVPGTGRDVNNLRDAGDVMAILRELEVDLVLSGHRHVPYVWSISGVRVVHSGTVSTLRVRGTMPPSYNVIEIDGEEVRIAMRQPGQGSRGEEPLARFAREAVTTSRFYPELDRFVRYDADPFSPPTASVRDSTSAEARRVSGREQGPTIDAILQGGPLEGRRVDAGVVEGRPPKTIDLEADNGSMCRYCLAEWTQGGPSAVYTFLYRV